MELDYDNPNSKWVAGFGCLYVPWANSLDTIDGGYFGRRIAQGVTTGVFAGSTPDPTSWSYSPDRQIGGTLVNFEGGIFDSLRYTSTAGIALSSIKWDLDRPFVFFENGIYYKNLVSVYHSLIADAPQGLTTNALTPAPASAAAISLFPTSLPAEFPSMSTTTISAMCQLRRHSWLARNSSINFSTRALVLGHVSRQFGTCFCTRRWDKAIKPETQDGR